jgi:type II pantothenate kinase
MKAGIDCGSTLIKIALQKGKSFKFYSQADYSKQQLDKILKQNFITKKIYTGLKADQNIAREIKLQVQGVRALAKLPKKFILVSIGTGTSYTLVSETSISRLPLGNSLGGGFIFGLGKALGFKDFKEITNAAKRGNLQNADIYFKNLIVANLAKINQKTKKADLAAGLMNIIAITTMKDLMLYKVEKENIVFIGSTLKNNACLKELLKKYFKKAIFIKNGEFATAVGALLSRDN